MADEKLIESIRMTFSLFGLIIARNLRVSLAKQLQSVADDERDSWIMQIAENVLSQNITDPHVEAEHIKLAVEQIIKPNTLKATETVLNVINAFDIPKIKYDICKKKFVLEQVTSDLFPEAKYKSLVFRDRFDMLWYRTLRHEIFIPPKFGEKHKDKVEITPIEYLMSESKTGNVCVLGLLSQLTEGQYYLEDPGGSVKIDLKQANFQDNLIVDGSIVLAIGDYDDGMLTVTDIGFPPPESADNSRVDFGDSNTFGGPNKTLLKFSEKLQNHEEANRDGMIIIISEFWVDNSTVLQKFKTMLDGYSDIPPIAFVICGNFLSFPSNLTSMQKMREGFKELAEIIVKYSDIKESTKFIFIPGPYDIGSPQILPRVPLPKCVTEEFLKLIPDAIFTTNPCRIQYCTKEIVVLREDLLTKMCRNTLRFLNEGNVCEQYAKSIICQSHLASLSLPVSPIYWKYDHTLQVYPTPDLIVVADQFESYSTKYSNCHVINPGMFPKNNFSFKVYVPALDVIEDCEIPNEIEGP